MSEPTIKCPHCQGEIPLTESLAGPLLESTRQEFEKKLEKTNREQAKAMQQQAKAMEQERKLDEDRRQFELSVEKKVRAGLQETRKRAKTEAEENFKLRIEEKGKTISDLQKKIEELKEKAEQGSQQLQGEVQELALEDMLNREFPLDTIEPVPTGQLGADVIQRVVSKNGQQCGTILWESKRTKNWSNTWLGKLREDRTSAEADIAVIVSKALPKNVDGFQMIEDIWVANTRLAVPVATLLRQSLIEVAQARRTGERNQTKTEMLYEYLTGPTFRQHVNAIVMAFSTMQTDLEKEKRAMSRQWAKRDKQIDIVMQATTGMYGQLQGIAGSTLKEIDGLDMSLLEADIESPIEDEE